MARRLVKIAKELNVGTATIVEYLTSNGFEIENKPTGLIDAWFLDGFAPSKNPEMWTQALFDHMARLAKDECTFATFTAAGHVRRGLIEAGLWPRFFCFELGSRRLRIRKSSI